MDTDAGNRPYICDRSTWSDLIPSLVSAIIWHAVFQSDVFVNDTMLWWFLFNCNVLSTPEARARASTDDRSIYLSLHIDHLRGASSEQTLL